MTEHRKKSTKLTLICGVTDFHAPRAEASRSVASPGCVERQVIPQVTRDRVTQPELPLMFADQASGKEMPR